MTITHTEQEFMDNPNLIQEVHEKLKNSVNFKPEDNLTFFAEKKRDLISITVNKT